MYLFLSLKERQSFIFEAYCAVFIGCTTAVTHCHLLLFVATRCHSLPLVAPLVVTRCHSLYHSLSLLVIHYYSLPFFVTCCHLMYHSFINDQPITVVYKYKRKLLFCGQNCGMFKLPGRSDGLETVFLCLDRF